MGLKITVPRDGGWKEKREKAIVHEDGEGGRGFSPQIGERVDAATGTAAYARAPRQYGRR